MELIQLNQNKVFDGWHQQYQHHSSSLNCDMRFALFLPPNASPTKPVPVLYWLSGLTCSDENFMQKAAAFHSAAQLGIAIVAPDTSPRGAQVPDAQDASYDLGLGAGFYVNATQAPWEQHYQMYSYVLQELPELIETHFPVNQKRALAGHSMGGHGALTIGIKNQDRYRSISAFSPICHPSAVPWGQKAFRHYLGEDSALWAAYDAYELLQSHKVTLPILIDQGLADPFLTEQLSIDEFETLAQQQSVNLDLRRHPDYDHSYYFIQSFIHDHIAFHAKHLA